MDYLVMHLEGSFTCRCPEIDFTYTQKRHGVIDPVCREALRRGVDPKRPVLVLRDGKRVFASEAPVGEQAKYRLRENDHPRNGKSWERVRYNEAEAARLRALSKRKNK